MNKIELKGYKFSLLKYQITLKYKTKQMEKSFETFFGSISHWILDKVLARKDLS